MTHTLHIQTKWYNLIASGKKVLEGRLADKSEGVTDIKLGESILFHTEGHAPLRVEVISIDHYPDFTTMLSDGRLERLLPGIDSIEEGVEIYRSFPQYRALERQYGAVVFGIISNKA